MTALVHPSLEDVTAGLRAHSGSKAMYSRTASVARLVRSFRHICATLSPSNYSDRQKLVSISTGPSAWDAVQFGRCGFGGRSPGLRTVSGDLLPGELPSQEDFEEGLVGRAGQPPLDLPFLVYEESGREREDFVCSNDVVSLVQPDRIRDTGLLRKSLGLFQGVRHRHAHEHYVPVTVLVPHRLEEGHLPPAWRAPRRPEVQYDHFAFQVGKTQRPTIEGLQLKVGGGPELGLGARPDDPRSRGRSSCDSGLRYPVGSAVGVGGAGVGSGVAVEVEELRSGCQPVLGQRSAVRRTQTRESVSGLRQPWMARLKRLSLIRYGMAGL